MGRDFKPYINDDFFLAARQVKVIVRYPVIGITLLVLSWGGVGLCEEGKSQYDLRLQSVLYFWQDKGDRDRFLNSHNAQLWFKPNGFNGLNLEAAGELREGNSNLPGQEESRLVALNLNGSLAQLLNLDNKSSSFPYIHLGRVTPWYAGTGTIDGLSCQWKTPNRSVFILGGREVYLLTRIKRNDLPNRWKLGGGWEERIPQGRLYLRHFSLWRKGGNTNPPDELTQEDEESQAGVSLRKSSVHFTSHIAYGWISRQLRRWDTRLSSRSGGYSYQLFYEYHRWPLYRSDPLHQLPNRPSHFLGAKLSSRISAPQVTIEGTLRLRLREDDDPIPQITIGAGKDNIELGVRGQIGEDLGDWGMWCQVSGVLLGKVRWDIDLSSDYYQYEFTDSWQTTLSSSGSLSAEIWPNAHLEVGGEYYRDPLIKNDLRWRISLIYQFSS